MSINKDSLIVGMKFKPAEDNLTSIYGICKEITEDRFIFMWVYSDSSYNSEHSLSISTALSCFNYYGWRVLSELEGELL